MKKYIRATICIVYSFIKFYYMKLFHIKKFKFTTLNLVSPFSEIEIAKKAELSLGKMVRMRGGVKISVRNSAKVSIGDNTFLNNGCMVISHEKVIIGQDVQCGPNVLIYDHDHDFRVENGLKGLKYKTDSVEIGDNVWIGANTVILRGTKIGNNCVIGAGSIVKGEYPENVVIIQKRETIQCRIVGDR